jgi:hypothetical protein
MCDVRVEASTSELESRIVVGLNGKPVFSLCPDHATQLAKELLALVDAFVQLRADQRSLMEQADKLDRCYEDAHEFDRKNGVPTYEADEYEDQDPRAMGWVDSKGRP